MDDSATETAALRVAVLGPGGVGGLLAGLLARAGHDVLCIARDSTAEILRAEGVHVRSGMFGEFTARVSADTALREPVDLCFVTVKHTALDDGLERVSAEALGDGLIIPLLNGVEHPQALRERYRPELVVPGVIRVEATRLQPGVIVHTSPFADIELASGTASRRRMEAAAQVLAGAGFGSRVRDDEGEMLWAKMGFLAPTALLTTRYMQTVGEIRTEHGAELSAAIAEVAAVAGACGAKLDPARIEGFFRAVQADMKSSMLRDAEAGRPIELDAIGGSVLRAAALHGVPVPVFTELVLRLSSR